MNTLTTEQIREILAGAPDGATHFQDCDGSKWYFKSDGLGFTNCSDECEPDVENIVGIHMLCDLREILKLRERVAELEDNIDMTPLKHGKTFTSDEICGAYILVMFDSESQMAEFSGGIYQSCMCRNPIDEPAIHEFTSSNVLAGYLRGENDAWGNKD